MIKRSLVAFALLALASKQLLAAQTSRDIETPWFRSALGENCPGFPNVAKRSQEAGPDYKRKYDTIAHRFLDNEAELGQVTPAMYALLDDVIDDAVKLLPAHRADQPLSPAAAADTLRQIDCLLLSHGFVYPGQGWVLRLSTGLAPMPYDQPSDWDQLIASAHNSRRDRFIRARGRGPYNVVDCDTASYIYLAIAEVLQYPLSFVEIPLHNFVRWKFDDETWLNFETMDGIVTDDAYYVTNWGIASEFIHQGPILRSFSRTEFEAYHLDTVALMWARRHDYASMVRTYERALTLDASDTLALNNLAWFYAAVPNTALRDGDKAVAFALRAVDALPTGDHLDTLACAYAQAGKFKEAIDVENRAIKTRYAPQGSDLRTTLDLLLAGQTCNDTNYGTATRQLKPSNGLE